MSSGYRGKTTNLARDVTATQAQAEREAQWGEMPGEVKSYDPATQTATIQPLYRPKHRGEPIDMPELLEVPVRHMRAGGGGMTFPVKAGDRVTLRPQMRASERYHIDGDYEATDTRSFSLSDYEAFLDGGESLNDPIPNFDAENTHVRFDPDGQYGIRGSEDGKIAIEGAEGNIYSMIADFMELVANDGLNITTGSSAGVGIHQMENRAALLEIAGKIRAMEL